MSESRVLAVDAGECRRMLVSQSSRLRPGEVVVVSADGGPVTGETPSWVTPMARSVIRVEPDHFVWLGAMLFKKFEARNCGRLNEDGRAIMVWRDRAGQYVIAVGVVSGSACEAEARAVFEGYPTCQVSVTGEAQF